MAEEERKEVEEAEVETVEEAEAEEEVVEVSKKSMNDMDDEELHAELEVIEAKRKQLLIFMILAAAFEVAAIIFSPSIALYGLGTIIVVPCSIASTVFSILGFIFGLLLFLKLDKFTDPHGYLNEDEKKKVADAKTFALVEFIVCAALTVVII